MSDTARPNAPGPGVTERITVNLTPKAADGLRRLQERTGLSKTDLINRAVLVYEFIESHLSAGYDLLIREPKSGEIEVIRIL
jgi:hypothetical protein